MKTKSQRLITWLMVTVLLAASVLADYRVPVVSLANGTAGKDIGQYVNIELNRFYYESGGKTYYWVKDGQVQTLPQDVPPLTVGKTMNLMYNWSISKENYEAQVKTGNFFTVELPSKVFKYLKDENKEVLVDDTVIGHYDLIPADEKVQNSKSVLKIKFDQPQETYQKYELLKQGEINLFCSIKEVSEETEVDITHTDTASATLRIPKVQNSPRKWRPDEHPDLMINKGAWWHTGYNNASWYIQINKGALSKMYKEKVYDASSGKLSEIRLEPQETKNLFLIDDLKDNLELDRQEVRIYLEFHPPALQNETQELDSEGRYAGTVFRKDIFFPWDSSIGIMDSADFPVYRGTNRADVKNKIQNNSSGYPAIGIYRGSSGEASVFVHLGTLPHAKLKYIHTFATKDSFRQIKNLLEEIPTIRAKVKEKTFLPDDYNTLGEEEKTLLKAYTKLTKEELDALNTGGIVEKINDTTKKLTERELAELEDGVLKLFLSAENFNSLKEKEGALKSLEDDCRAKLKKEIEKSNYGMNDLQKDAMYTFYKDRHVTDYTVVIYTKPIEAVVVAKSKIYNEATLKYNDKEMQSNLKSLLSQHSSVLVKAPDKKIDIRVQKRWIGENGVTLSEGLPDFIDVELRANGVLNERKTLSKTSGWKAVFSEKPFYQEGEAIDYKVVEVKGAGNSQFVDTVSGNATSGFVITNRENPLLSIKVTKTWQGDPAASCKVILTANGNEDGSVILNQENNWEHTFLNKPKKDADYQDIRYSVKEVELPGYTSEITGNVTDGFVITNTQKKLTIEVTKKWIAANNVTEEAGPEKPIDVALMLGEKEAARVQLSKASGWKAEFPSVLEYAQDGTRNIYSVKELTDVPGYTAISTPIVLVNDKGWVTLKNVKKAHETLQIKVKKQWRNADSVPVPGNTPGLPAVEIKLKRNNEVIDKVVLKDGTWEHTFTNLLKKDSSDRDYVYTVEEVAITGYTSSVSKDAEGFVITNTQKASNPPTVIVPEQNDPPKPPSENTDQVPPVPEQPKDQDPVSEIPEEEPEKVPDNPDSEEPINDSDIPSFTPENIPDPKDPDSPDTILVISEDGTPKVYTKVLNDQNEEIYMDENGIPLANTNLPKTVDGTMSGVINPLTVGTVLSMGYGVKKLLEKKRNEASGKTKKK